jgi:ribonuclease HIII
VLSILIVELESSPSSKLLEDEEVEEIEEALKELKLEIVLLSPSSPSYSSLLRSLRNRALTLKKELFSSSSIIIELDSKSPSILREVL